MLCSLTVVLPPCCTDLHFKTFSHFGAFNIRTCDVSQQCFTLYLTTWRLRRHSIWKPGLLALSVISEKEAVTIKNVRWTFIFYVRRKIQLVSLPVALLKEISFLLCHDGHIQQKISDLEIRIWPQNVKWHGAQNRMSLFFWYFMSNLLTPDLQIFHWKIFLLELLIRETFGSKKFS